MPDQETLHSVPEDAPAWVHAFFQFAQANQEHFVLANAQGDNVHAWIPHDLPRVAELRTTTTHLDGSNLPEDMNRALYAWVSGNAPNDVGCVDFWRDLFPRKTIHEIDNGVSMTLLSEAELRTFLRELRIQYH